MNILKKRWFRVLVLAVSFTVGGSSGCATIHGTAGSESPGPAAVLASAGIGRADQSYDGTGYTTKHDGDSSVRGPAAA